MQVLYLQTDGGPDRNNTFLNVQLAYMALALSLPQLQMLVVKRCAPGQSYVNPAERAMSTLNAVLSGTALALDDFGDDLQKALKHCNNMEQVRSALREADETSCLPHLRRQYQAAVAPCQQEVTCQALRLRKYVD
jgi:hypothetical protein